ncbi:hypothetical protein XENTR_v10009166 [Xenopus tropicalis]|nr:hypothetical protein XENTR_v10009166 [Xenopus tropicalis]
MSFPRIIHLQRKPMGKFDLSYNQEFLIFTHTAWKKIEDKSSP